MKTFKQTLILISSLVFVACGGGAEEAGHEGHAGGEHGDHEHQHHHDGGEEHSHHHGHHDGEHDGHHEGGHHGEHHGQHEEHGEMTPALGAFHEAFAAHWHGDRSSEAVCPDAENLRQLAQAAATEVGDETLTTETNASADAVVSACAEDGDFDASFERFHHALHALMEAG